MDEQKTEDQDADEQDAVVAAEAVDAAEDEAEAQDGATEPADDGGDVVDDGATEQEATPEG